MDDGGFANRESYDDRPARCVMHGRRYCDFCDGEYEAADTPDVDAAGNCYSDADPGL